MEQIQIILGCMFSGKTTELIRRVSRYEAINMKTIIINHCLDTRTDNSVKTHNNLKKKALKLNKLMDFLQNPLFNKINVIGIDEAQFFNDLLEFVKFIDKTNKILIIAGLDGDYERKPFGEILKCIPYCDNVVKLKSMCMISNDGTPGIFTKRIISSTKQKIIGDNNIYKSVCRKYYYISFSKSTGNSFI